MNRPTQYIDLPDDLPLPVDDNHGVFLPATAVVVQNEKSPEGITGYDPWTHADLAATADQAQPEIGPYNEPSYFQAESIVAEWGGMPSPVKPFQESSSAVLALRRPVYNNSGPTGRFYGPQQTAWEASYQEPTTDYWSVLIGG